MANTIVHMPQGTGPSYWVFGGRFTFLVTGEETDGTYCTMEMFIPPHTGSGPHIHHHTDEQFYILEGELTYSVGDQTLHAFPGDLVHIPRGTPHAFKNGPAPAKLLATIAPAGVEKFFQEVGYPVNDQTPASPPVTAETIARAGSRGQGRSRDRPSKRIKHQ